jgi:hypothetical protein
MHPAVEELIQPLQLSALEHYVAVEWVAAYLTSHLLRQPTKLLATWFDGSYM